MARLLLISNSTLHGGGYLDHCAQEFADFLGPEVERVAFVPHALQDRAGYVAKVRERLATLGYEVESVDAGSPARSQAVVRETQAFFVGGGNTFRLLAALYANGLIAPMRERVLAGAPYVGSSAGSNVACITIKTTNDMPIVAPPSLDALALVPFNINPHYQDPDPRSTHMGETREQRIREFHEENEPPVVGLREGAWLRVEGQSVVLGGTRGARLFRRGHDSAELATGARLDALLAPAAR